MKPLYTVAEIRHIESAAAGTLPPCALMQRAGQAAANVALDLLAAARDSGPVLVLAGPGNNGGDALEVAAHLAHAGHRVTILHLEPQGDTALERQQALQRARSSPAAFDTPDPAAVRHTRWGLVIDGLFGIGLQRALSGLAAALTNAVNERDGPVLALDVPSGLDADAGVRVGGGPAIVASHTITFIGDKPGLHTCDGRDHAGQVHIATLDIAAALYPATQAQLNDVGLFAHRLQQRRHSSHKGSYGNVAVLGGAPGMAGAPILAARTALQSGAGKVFACFVGQPLTYDPVQPELMCRAAQQFDFSSAALVLGPGLGTAPASAEILAEALRSPAPAVVDADALNLVAGDASLRTLLCQRTGQTLLTPHPLEAARLLQQPAAEIQGDRLGAARRLARDLNAIVVLKGSGSVIAAPDGMVAINPTGNPALASAGTGDVLSGLSGALLAQGWPAWEAALGAVWLHGTAADLLVAEGIGPIGLSASELIPAIRRALNALTKGTAR